MRQRAKITGQDRPYGTGRQRKTAKLHLPRSSRRARSTASPPYGGRGDDDQTLPPRLAGRRPDAGRRRPSRPGGQASWFRPLPSVEVAWGRVAYSFCGTNPSDRCQVTGDTQNSGPLSRRGGARAAVYRFCGTNPSDRRQVIGDRGQRVAVYSFCKTNPICQKSCLPKTMGLIGDCGSHDCRPGGAAWPWAARRGSRAGGTAAMRCGRRARRVRRAP